MNLQHRNQAPRPQNRHRFDLERKSLKKPEAPGSAGRCEKGTGCFTAPALSPAFLSHPSRCSYPGIFNLAFVGPNLAFWGLGWVRSPPWGESPHTGSYRAKQAGPGFVLLGTKKPLPGFAWQRPVGCLIHLFSKNVPHRPHKRKAMRSVSWSVTRRNAGFPRMQAPT